MIVADYHLGEIRAVVGGLQTEYAGFNRALMSKRQIGSLVKPSIYLTALMNPEQFRLNTRFKTSQSRFMLKVANLGNLVTTIANIAVRLC